MTAVSGHTHVFRVAGESLIVKFEDGDNVVGGQREEMTAFLKKRQLAEGDKSIAFTEVAFIRVVFKECSCGSYYEHDSWFYKCRITIEQMGKMLEYGPKISMTAWKKHLNAANKLTIETLPNQALRTIARLLRDEDKAKVREVTKAFNRFI